MKQILENLRKAVVLSETVIQELKEHLAGNYPHLSAAEQDEVMQKYLEKQVEVCLKNFDEKYRLFIRRQLYRNTASKRPDEVSGLDILKACLQLNLDSEGFYHELKLWILSYPENKSLGAEASGVLNLIRQMSKDYPGMTFEEIIATEQLFTDASKQVINQNLASKPLDKADFSSLGSLEQVYCSHDLPDEEFRKFRPSVFQKRITLAVLCVVVFCLVMVSSFGFLVTVIDNTFGKKAQIEVAQEIGATQAVQPEATVATVQKAPEQPRPSMRINHLVMDNRIKRDRLANRSYKPARRALAAGGAYNKIRSNSTAEALDAEVTPVIPSVSTSVKAPVKSGENGGDKTVIVGYTEANDGNSANKVPLVKTFSKKLKLKANTDNVSSDSLTATADTSGFAASEPTKDKTVVIDPKVISSGSQVYIKYPQAHQDLNGVYTAEASGTKDSAKQSKIVLRESTNMAGKNDKSGVSGNEVEVYVLDSKE